MHIALICCFCPPTWLVSLLTHINNFANSNTNQFMQQMCFGSHWNRSLISMHTSYIQHIAYTFLCKYIFDGALMKSFEAYYCKFWVSCCVLHEEYFINISQSLGIISIPNVIFLWWTEYEGRNETNSSGLSTKLSLTADLFWSRLQWCQFWITTLLPWKQQGVLRLHLIWLCMITRDSRSLLWSLLQPNFSSTQVWVHWGHNQY